MTVSTITSRLRKPPGYEGICKFAKNKSLDSHQRVVKNLLSSDFSNNIYFDHELIELVIFLKITIKQKLQVVKNILVSTEMTL